MKTKLPARQLNRAAINKFNSMSHWNERQLEALCLGFNPDAYDDTCGDDEERKRVRSEIRQACVDGRLHAEKTGKGNAMYGDQWRSERISAIRWGWEYLPIFPTQFVNPSLKENWAQQDTKRLASGRYTLHEAAKTVCEATGERYDQLLCKLMRDVKSGGLRVYEPGMQQRHEYETGATSKVREYYDEAYWNDLNLWLQTNELLIAWRFPRPKLKTDTIRVSEPIVSNAAEPNQVETLKSSGIRDHKKNATTNKHADWQRRVEEKKNTYPNLSHIQICERVLKDLQTEGTKCSLPKAQTIRRYTKLR